MCACTYAMDRFWGQQLTVCRTKFLFRDKGFLVPTKTISSLSYSLASPLSSLGLSTYIFLSSSASATPAPSAGNDCGPKPNLLKKKIEDWVWWFAVCCVGWILAGARAMQACISTAVGLSKPFHVRTAPGIGRAETGCAVAGHPRPHLRPIVS